MPGSNRSVRPTATVSALTSFVPCMSYSVTARLGIVHAALVSMARPTVSGPSGKGWPPAVSASLQ